MRRRAFAIGMWVGRRSFGGGDASRCSGLICGIGCVIWMSWAKEGRAIFLDRESGMIDG